MALKTNWSINSPKDFQYTNSVAIIFFLWDGRGYNILEGELQYSNYLHQGHLRPIDKYLQKGQLLPAVLGIRSGQLCPAISYISSG